MKLHLCCKRSWNVICTLHQWSLFLFGFCVIDTARLNQFNITILYLFFTSCIYTLCFNLTTVDNFIWVSINRNKSFFDTICLTIPLQVMLLPCLLLIYTGTRWDSWASRTVRATRRKGSSVTLNFCSSHMSVEQSLFTGVFSVSSFTKISREHYIWCSKHRCDLMK